LCDIILFAILAVGLSLLLSTVLGVDAQQEKMASICSQYVKEYGLDTFMTKEELDGALSITVTEERYNVFTEEQKAKNFQKYLQILAENYVYHSQRPCPAPLLRNKFEQTCSIQIPELNAEKIPTDKFYTVSITQLPELMRSRPDSELIKYEIISRFFRLHNIASTDVKKALANLIETLQKCRNSIIFSSSSREIKNDIEKVYEAIDYQSEIEDLLYKTELENLNFYQLYPYEIKTINEYFNSMGSSEIQRLMLETEENFYGTF
jgi:hypothetical protein